MFREIFKETLHTLVDSVWRDIKLLKECTARQIIQPKIELRQIGRFTCRVGATCEPIDFVPLRW